MSKLIIDLNGPQGNVFYLIAVAKKISKQMGYSEADTTKLISEMASKDYSHLLEVFKQNFEHFVTIKK